VANTDIISGLKPERLWYHFAKISEIPRGSKNEAAVMAYIRDFATRHDLAMSEDEVGNIVIRKAAKPGYENLPGVVLQGHTDMVCEKNKGTEHDFEKDPIRLQRDGDAIRATGTTLGADNGIGFCAALAVLEADDIAHGPLEALFTIDEETGMTGAFSLQPDFLRHRVMLNMDSEEDGAIYVGCAGGQDTVGTFVRNTAPLDAGDEVFKLTVDGLKGGHSGLEIHLGLGNAIRFMARILHAYQQKTELRFVHLEGGSKRNAIPREAEAVFAVAKGQRAELEAITAAVEADLRSEFADVEPAMQIALEPASTAPEALTAELSGQLLGALFSLPHGFTVMSRSLPGLVETSTNLATLTSTAEAIVIGTSQRSFIDSAKRDLAFRVAHILTGFGARVETGKDYPGWQPNMDAAILNVGREAMQSVNGKVPEVKAIHAGLECGIIGEKYPGMEMISFGPTIRGAHSPDEEVSISAVEKFWQYLLFMLKNVRSAA
jgi:dipeptidase D